MLSYLTTAALISSMLFAPALIPASEKAVTFTGSMQPKAEQANHFTVTVALDITEGWHLYDDVGEGSEVRTSLQCKLPEGVKVSGEWNRPFGIDGKAANSRVYLGQVDFTRTVVIEPSAYGKTIDVVISYQACTEEYCNPPQSKTVSIAIPEKEASAASLFERPVRIMVKDAPLNTVAKKRFVSPAIFDVDGDGQEELVIGELMGRIGFYENLNTSGQGDPVWGPWAALKSATGEAIQTPNW